MIVFLPALFLTLVLAVILWHDEPPRRGGDGNGYID